MELRQQLATKTMEASTTQGCEGNVTWLKRHLREAHDMIVQLHEAQWLLEKRYAKHSRECEMIEEIAPCSSCQREEETRLAEFIPTSANKHKENLDSFERDISLRHFSILIMAMTVYNHLPCTFPPTNERGQKIKSLQQTVGL
jgi:hypothetical protein